MGISDAYGCVVYWLADEFNKLIEIKKDTLPAHAIRREFPSFIWMSPPQNTGFGDNEFCAKFTRSLENVLAVLDNHTMFKLKKIWSFDEPTLYLDDKFTKRGFRHYWYSVNSAIEFWHTHLASKRIRQGPQQQQQQQRPRVPSAVFLPRREGPMIHVNDFPTQHPHQHATAHRWLDYDYQQHRSEDPFRNRNPVRCDRFHWT